MKKLTSIFLLALVVHVATSLIFILDPPFLKSTSLSRIYKTYLLPGPFFTDTRIVDNYSLSLSWKVNDKWTLPITPAWDDFNRYHASLNPTELYRSRMKRTLYLRLTLPESSINDVKSRKEFHQLKQYLNDQNIPREADSVRIWIINKQAANFRLKADSVSVVFSR